MHFNVVAEYQEYAAEGINVVSKTLIDDLRAAGHSVHITAPSRILQSLPAMILRPSEVTVFTHGPGTRTVLASLILRALSGTRIIWVATRPDLDSCPKWLRSKRTAHTVICNRASPNIRSVANDANFIQEPIGIAPERVERSSNVDLWPNWRQPGVPLAVHVGHLRRSRGLEHMIAIKKMLGKRIELVVQASPYFEPAPRLLEELTDAGVHVVRSFVPAIADVYHSADLYLFPVPPEKNGAIDLPLSVLEAMACRIPVISTEFGALPRVLEGEVGVTLVPTEEFTTAVKAWVDTPTERRLRPAGLPPALDAHRIAETVERYAT